VLKLMGKGTSAVRNLELLKWSKELGLTPLWNLIWGFAGEAPADYDRMADLVPLIVHLPPPAGFGPLRSIASARASPIRPGTA